MYSLYVVATPIGNLEDMTIRGLRVLRSVKLIAAEDTRTTRHLLDNYEIETPLTSYHQHNRWSKLEYVLRFLAEEGDVALVSDAGTPGMSDPGLELITAAYERGATVLPIPGPSVVVTALSVSGLPTDRFTYVGFLPRRASDRHRLLQAINSDPGTLVMFEAPHRLQDALKDLLSILGDRRMAICRELTKIHEEVFRARVSATIAHFVEPRGEFTLLVEGHPGQEENRPGLTEEIERQLSELRHRGASAKEAIGRISAETGLARRELYRAWLNLG